MKRYAFTIIELVFVIVILGILAAVAIPRLGSTVNDANIAKGRSDVAAIRAAIVSERQGRLLQGQTNYINQLDDANYNAGQILFDNNGTATNVLLQYGIVAEDADGHWRKTASNVYKFKLNNADNTFEYNSTNGEFRCTGGANCADLVN